MKQDDFERLKAICEKEGFDIIGHWDEGMVIVKKTDPWEGVEFVECVKWNGKLSKQGQIHPIKKDNGLEILLLDGNWHMLIRDIFKPSTETAYVEQLKKEAFERFGEINQDTILDRTPICTNIITGSVNQIMGSNQSEEWSYNKELDALYYCSVLIYEKGKWAERVKERVTVGINDGGIDVEMYNSYHSFIAEFIVSDKLLVTDKIRDEWTPFLASQLEKYLNGEIE